MPLVFIRPPPSNCNSDFDYRKPNPTKKRNDSLQSQTTTTASTGTASALAKKRADSVDKSASTAGSGPAKTQLSMSPGAESLLCVSRKTSNSSSISGGVGDFSWPRSVLLTLRLDAFDLDLSSFFYLIDKNFSFFEHINDNSPIHDSTAPTAAFQPQFLNFSVQYLEEDDVIRFKNTHSNHINPATHADPGPRPFGSPKKSTVLLNFLFPESVVLMRSQFKFVLKQLRHEFCDQTIVLDPPVETTVAFACEKTTDQNCLTNIPPYSPFCVTPQNISTSLVEKKGWEAIVEIRLHDFPFDDPLSPNPRIQYAALYGPCAVSLQTFGLNLALKLPKNRCQLRVDAIWKKNICETPFRNCQSSPAIKIPHVYVSLSYGILLCGFQADAEFPNNKTMLRQLALAQVIELPVNLMHHDQHYLSHDGEMRTFLAYGAILVILFGLLLITLIQKRRQRKPLAANMLQFLKADEWELDEPDVLIHFIHKIGMGSTSEVYRGKLSRDFKTPANGPVVLDDSYQVAVKILKKNATEAQKTEFLSEIEINKLIGRHNRVVNLIGVMQLRKPPLIVFEFCPNGDLRRYLHKSRTYIWELEAKGFNLREMDDIHAIPHVNEEFVFTLKRIVRLAIQICLGMEFLASRQIIHGDLATRNVFLTAKNSVKVGDFGTARKETDSSKLQALVLTDNRSRWAAPEILQQDFQCLASDAWSFGVVLYELMTLGAIPYHSVSDSAGLVHVLNSGERLHQSAYCPDDMYHQMTKCWSTRPENRPNFSELTNTLTEFYDATDAKDNKENYYLTPDPDKNLYILPLSKASLPTTHSTLGWTDSGPPTPKSSVSSFQPKTARNLAAKAASNNALLNASRNSESEAKGELIQETERLLGFS